MRTWLPVRVETLWWLRVRGLRRLVRLPLVLDATAVRHQTNAVTARSPTFPPPWARRAASRMLYCPRRKRTGARLLVAARFHSRINGLADECVEHMLYLLDRASDGFSRLGPISR
jgi:hypothetical protein